MESEVEPLQEELKQLQKKLQVLNNSEKRFESLLAQAQDNYVASKTETERQMNSKILRDQEAALRKTQQGILDTKLQITKMIDRLESAATANFMSIRVPRDAARPAKGAAELVQGTLDETMSLAEQQRVLPGLVKPFPYVLNARERSTATGSVYDDRRFAMLLVDRTGSASAAFAQAMKFSIEDFNSQNQHILSVVQASGAGKSKLCIDASLKEGMPSVVLTAVEPGGEQLTPPFRALQDAHDECLKDFEARVAATKGGADLTRLRSMYFEVLACAHVEWAAAVLAELAADDERNGRGKRSTEQVMMALHLCRMNSVAPAGIAAIVSQRLQSLPHLGVRKLEEHVQRYVSNARRGLLVAMKACTGTPLGMSNLMMIAVDEAPKLIFERFSSGQPGNVVWLECAARAAISLMEHDIPVAFVGTYFDVPDLINADVMDLRNRGRTFSQSDFITAEMFWDLLRGYAPSLPDTPPSCLSELKDFEGRPIFFFDRLLEPAVYASLNEGVHFEPVDCPGVTCPTALRLIAALRKQLPIAHDGCLKPMIDRIEMFVTSSQAVGKRSVLPNAHEIKHTISMLSSVFLGGGQLQPITEPVTPGETGDVDIVAMQDGVRKGVFVWDPARDPKSVMQEPFVIKAIETIGRDKALQRHPSNDIMLNYWADDVSSDPDRKGKLLEQAVAWMLLRACADGPASLLQELEDSIPDGVVDGELRRALDGLLIDVRQAAPVGQMRSRGLQLNDWSCTEDVHTVWHSFSTFYGMDLLLRTTTGNPIGIQVNSGGDSFADAVASCTMGWQGLSRKGRTQYDSLSTRASFVDGAVLGSDKPHVRLIVSAGGFTEDAIEAAIAHNELHPESAILPLTVNESLFGPLASRISTVNGAQQSLPILRFDGSEQPADLLLCQAAVDLEDFSGRGLAWDEYLTQEQGGRS